MSIEQAMTGKANPQNTASPATEQAAIAVSDVEGRLKDTLLTLNWCACTLSTILRRRTDLSVDTEEDICRALDDARRVLKKNGVSVGEL